MAGGDDRVEQIVVVQNAQGLHARAAGKFVQTAAKFPRCEVTVAKGATEVNGKSILSLLTLMAPKGTTLTLRVRGDRAAELVAALVALIDDKFGEGR